MNKTVKTATLLRTTWKTFHESMLDPDEFTFFVWLFTKASKEDWKEFPASINDVERQVKIKRGKQETIIRKFVGMGWLKAGKVSDEYGVPYRSFYVDITRLAEEDVLRRMFYPRKEGVYTDLLILFQGISKSS